MGGLDKRLYQMILILSQVCEPLLPTSPGVKVSWGHVHGVSGGWAAAYPHPLTPDLKVIASHTHFTGTLFKASEDGGHVPCLLGVAQR